MAALTPTSGRRERVSERREGMINTSSILWTVTSLAALMS